MSSTFTFGLCIGLDDFVAPRKRKRTAPSTYLEDDFEFSPPASDSNEKKSKPPPSKEKSTKKAARESKKKTSGKKTDSKVLQTSATGANIESKSGDEKADTK